MSSDESAKIKKELLDLQKKRSDMESEILVFREILSTQGVGMDESLVDSEGFPRNDIDLYQVRTARNKIICLLNDCKEITKQLELKLHQFHELNRPS